MAYGQILGQSFENSPVLDNYFTKDETLTSNTAALFGFGASAVPNDMFNVLTHAGDLHVWKRTQNGVVDYPVSPNRNAYQEGSDAQPAGYTLGEMQSGEFEITPPDSSSYFEFHVSDSVNVEDTGAVSLGSYSTLQITYKNAESSFSSFSGKFVEFVKSQTGYHGNEWKGSIFFIPESASLITENLWPISVDKRQLVIGYPATPADNAIEYLGKLGDKGRIATGGYVGTGAYGSNNPTNLVIPFPAKLVAITSKDGNYYYGLFVYGATSVQTVHGSNTGTATVSWNGTYISFYGSGAANQLNNQGTEYYWVALG